jgi:hypothetical protein
VNILLIKFFQKIAKIIEETLFVFVFHRYYHYQETHSHFLDNSFSDSIAIAFFCSDKAIKPAQ